MENKGLAMKNQEKVYKCQSFHILAMVAVGRNGIRESLPYGILKKEIPNDKNF